MQEKVKTDDLMFVTTGMLSSDVYKSLYDITLKKNILIKILAATYVVLIVCIIWSACHNIGEYVVICVAAILLFSIAVVYKRNHSIKVSVYRIKELYGTDTVEYTTGFTNDFVYSQNNLRKEPNIAISYDNINSIYNTKKYIFLVTKGAQFITIFKSCLSDENQKKLVDFLKSKIH